jgi:hypothetical protein
VAFDYAGTRRPGRTTTALNAVWRQCAASTLLTMGSQPFEVIAEQPRIPPNDASRVLIGAPIQGNRRAGRPAVGARVRARQGNLHGVIDYSTVIFVVGLCNRVSCPMARVTPVGDLYLDFIDHMLAEFALYASFLPLSAPRPTPQSGWMADLLTALVLLVMVSTPAALMAALSYRCAPLPLGRRGRRMTQIRHHRPGQPVG